MNAETLRDDEFNQFRSWLHRTAEISLSDAKKALVSDRLSKRLKHHDLTSYDDYFRLITQNTEAAELQIALDLLTTNGTYFFREPKHFDFLSKQVLPKVQVSKTFRLWSAASSTGEEPYSLAMTLADGLPRSPWEIIAFDTSTRVLKKARSGHYDMERIHNIPQL
ncbi:MAG: CheR methyltransferase, all-alpha domain [Candidatus Nitrotoga sp. SPKER]|nr:MAG: CheR methyltransferase, all-alpha domain [Candidatus Nitrotoga sp. SPKER]